MFDENQIPNRLWDKACSFKDYLMNYSFTTLLKNHVTPKEAFIGEKPKMSHF
eukprot:c6799_g1_i1 orf=218-373(-)